MTGASRGIGRAIALRLADEGVRLALTARRSADLDETAERVEGLGIAADLTEAEEVERLVAAVRAWLGGAPDILVNNAGLFRLATVETLDPRELDRQLDLNLRAPILLARAFLPEMIGRDAGWLVHIGSVAGRRAFPENAAYAASKFGLRGFHEVLSLELQGTGVSSVLIEPGPVDTEAWDPVAGRLGHDLPARSQMLRPEEVASRVIAALGLPS